MTESFEDFDTVSLQPEDIKADKLTIKTIMLAQLNRLDFLLSVGLGQAVSKEKMKACAYGTMFALASLESLMANVLQEDEDYLQKAEPIKQQLFTPSGYKASIVAPEKNSVQWQAYIKGLQDNYSKHVFLCETAPAYSLQLCMMWYSLLVLKFGTIGLIPTKDGDLVFE